MKILDGKKGNEEMAESLTKQISGLKEKPKLVIIQAGRLKESDVYIKRKLEFAEKIGAEGFLEGFPGDSSTDQITSIIKELNQDNSVNGIIVQLPLPDQIDSTEVLNTISPTKDVDGLGETNLNDPNGVVPATARGIIELLKLNDIEVRDKKVGIIGSSLLGGQTISKVFEREGSDVSVYDIKTEDIPGKTSEADILVSAVGKPGLVTNDYVNENQVVIDVGITVDENGKVRGDTTDDLKVAAITPVPGGVGPMSVAALFENLLDAYNRQR